MASLVPNAFTLRTKAALFDWLVDHASLDQMTQLIADTPKSHWAEQIQQWMKAPPTKLL